jgi:hypothetical protein
MLLYRVVPVAPGTPPGKPGHPEYLHKPQGQGRLDNPAHYDMLYLSSTESGAVGETLAQFRSWTKAIFPFKKVPGAVLSLCTFEIADTIRLLEMDDPQTLLTLGLRPTQVVTPNRAVTQSWALRIWQEHDHRGRKWDGIRWWSRHHTDWPVMGLWNTSPHLDRVETLDINHRAVRDAAVTLNRPIRP